MNCLNKDKEEKYFEDNKSEAYEYIVWCANCEEENALEIPKGTTVNSHLDKSNVICDECGCKLIKGDEKE